MRRSLTDTKTLSTGASDTAQQYTPASLPEGFMLVSLPSPFDAEESPAQPVQSGGVPTRAPQLRSPSQPQSSHADPMAMAFSSSSVPPGRAPSAPTRPLPPQRKGPQQPSPMTGHLTDPTSALTYSEPQSNTKTGQRDLEEADEGDDGDVYSHPTNQRLRSLERHQQLPPQRSIEAPTTQRISLFQASPLRGAADINRYSNPIVMRAGFASPNAREVNSDVDLDSFTSPLPPPRGGSQASTASPHFQSPKLLDSTLGDARTLGVPSGSLGSSSAAPLLMNDSYLSDENEPRVVYDMAGAATSSADRHNVIEAAKPSQSTVSTGQPQREKSVPSTSVVRISLGGGPSTASILNAPRSTIVIKKSDPTAGQPTNPQAFRGASTAPPSSVNTSNASGPVISLLARAAVVPPSLQVFSQAEVRRHVPQSGEFTGPSNQANYPHLKPTMDMEALPYRHRSQEPPNVNLNVKVENTSSSDDESDDRNRIAHSFHMPVDSSYMNERYEDDWPGHAEKLKQKSPAEKRMSRTAKMAANDETVRIKRDTMHLAKLRTTGKGGAYNSTGLSEERQRRSREHSEAVSRVLSAAGSTQRTSSMRSHSSITDRGNTKARIPAHMGHQNTSKRSSSVIVNRRLVAAGGPPLAPAFVSSKTMPILAPASKGSHKPPSKARSNKVSDRPLADDPFFTSFLLKLKQQQEQDHTDVQAGGDTTIDNSQSMSSARERSISHHHADAVEVDNEAVILQRKIHSLRVAAGLADAMEGTSDTEHNNPPNGYQGSQRLTPHTLSRNASYHTAQSLGDELTQGSSPPHDSSNPSSDTSDTTSTSSSSSGTSSGSSSHRIGGVKFSELLALVQVKAAQLLEEQQRLLMERSGAVYGLSKVDATTDSTNTSVHQPTSNSIPSTTLRVGHPPVVGRVSLGTGTKAHSPMPMRPTSSQGNASIAKPSATNNNQPRGAGSQSYKSVKVSELQPHVKATPRPAQVPQIRSIVPKLASAQQSTTGSVAPYNASHQSQSAQVRNGQTADVHAVADEREEVASSTKYAEEIIEEEEDEEDNDEYSVPRAKFANMRAYAVPLDDGDTEATHPESDADESLQYVEEQFEAEEEEEEYRPGEEELDPNQGEADLEEASAGPLLSERIRKPSKRLTRRKEPASCTPTAAPTYLRNTVATAMMCQQPQERPRGDGRLTTSSPFRPSVIKANSISEAVNVRSSSSVAKYPRIERDKPTLSAEEIIALYGNRDPLTHQPDLQAIHGKAMYARMRAKGAVYSSTQLTMKRGENVSEENGDGSPDPSVETSRLTESSVKLEKVVKDSAADACNRLYESSPARLQYQHASERRQAAIDADVAEADARRNKAVFAVANETQLRLFQYEREKQEEERRSTRQEAKAQRRKERRAVKENSDSRLAGYYNLMGGTADIAPRASLAAISVLGSADPQRRLSVSKSPSPAAHEGATLTSFQSMGSFAGGAGGGSRADFSLVAPSDISNASVIAGDRLYVDFKTRTRKQQLAVARRVEDELSKVTAKPQISEVAERIYQQKLKDAEQRGTRARLIQEEHDRVQHAIIRGKDILSSDGFGGWVARGTVRREQETHPESISADMYVGSRPASYQDQLSHTTVTADGRIRSNSGYHYVRGNSYVYNEYPGTSNTY